MSSDGVPGITVAGDDLHHDAGLVMTGLSEQIWFLEVCSALNDLRHAASLDAFAQQYWYPAIRRHLLAIGIPSAQRLLHQVPQNIRELVFDLEDLFLQGDHVEVERRLVMFSTQFSRFASAHAARIHTRVLTASA